MSAENHAGPISSGKPYHPMYFPYMHFVIGVGLTAVALSLSQLPHSGIGSQWLILACLTVFTSSFSIRIPAINSKISIGDTLFFTNVILFGTAAGTITAAVEALAASMRSRNRSRRLLYALFNVAAMACSAHLGGTVFFSMMHRGPLLHLPAVTTKEILIPMGVLAFTHYLVNSGIVATIVALEKRKNAFLVWRDSFLWTSITYLAGAAAGAFIAINIGTITPQVVGVAGPVLMSVYFTYKTYLDKVNEVRSLAYYDSLTKLPNRILFREYLDQALASSQRHNYSAAVMFLDLDNFKRINDTYGHNVGDLLIRSVADRLGASLRVNTGGSRNHADEPDIAIGRFGGDEFNLLMTRLSSPQDAAKVAQSILEALSSPFELDRQEVTVTASIGISVYPYDGANADTLLKNADVAMFHVKDRGKSGYHFYSQSMNEISSRKLALENELRRALDRNEFRLYYQPKIDASTQQLTGAETLIRWQHPTRGILPAAEFIPLAEETGLIRPIGEWVLRTACTQACTWRNGGIPPIPLAVNLSSIQFRQEDLAQKVSQVLRDTSFDPSLLELEITESTIMENEGAAESSLLQLRALGVKISIDDFGTGYSSLSRLKSLTLDTLKIDRSFVKDLPENPNDRAITAAIISMAHNLELKVIAEGVETQSQFDFLRQQGCDQMQGYFIGKPMPEDQFLSLVADNNLGIRAPQTACDSSSSADAGTEQAATAFYHSPWSRKNNARLRVISMRKSGRSARRSQSTFSNEVLAEEMAGGASQGR